MKRLIGNNKKNKDIVNIKSMSGITLIALVITIIVMLILVRSSNHFINRRTWNA